ncbi:GNAT family N-acetyltransferase [Alkalihalobacillus sp. 1P02AB]|uniref:GNAT family N-acetyltransferase n=1 Tax=Alkalihalobacillus sp. 1P02AB TaxID=3132260 RepID=UPI0039A6A8A1
MKLNVKLIKANKEWLGPYQEFYDEWFKSGEKMVPWVIRESSNDAEAMFSFLQKQETGVGLSASQVKNTTYWLINEEEEVVGAVNIRHTLNSFLFEQGGHIGYGIRPSARQKGYATQILALALQESNKLGIKKVLVCCDEDNLASYKTIVKNGGMIDEDFVTDDGEVIKRFWVECE